MWGIAVVVVDTGLVSLSLVVTLVRSDLLKDCVTPPCPSVQAGFLGHPFELVSISVETL